MTGVERRVWLFGGEGLGRGEIPRAKLPNGRVTHNRMNQGHSRQRNYRLLALNQCQQVTYLEGHVTEKVNVLKSPTILKGRQERTGKGIVKSRIIYLQAPISSGKSSFLLN